MDENRLYKHLLTEVVQASDHHWADVSYIKSLSKIPEFSARIKRNIKTIAIYYYKIHNGGTERVTARLATIWAKAGYRVILLTDEIPREEDYSLGEGVERFILPPFRDRYVPRGYALAQILQKEKVDLFVSNLWFEIVTTWDLLVAKSIGVPVIIGWHNVFDAAIYGGNNLDRFALCLAGYRYADLVTALSTMDQFWFSTQGIASRLVHNPQTFDCLPEQIAPLASKNLLVLGRLERDQKRIDHIIRMMALVLQSVPDAKLVVVGDGPDRAAMVELARALGIGKSVDFIGFKTDVAPFIDSAALQVMASQFEGSPMALAEVWAHGVPTVMYELPFLEYVRSGKGHLAVAQNDIEALAAAAVKVLKDDELRARLGTEARAVAQSFFNVDLEKEWRQIFLDVETADCMNAPIEPSVAVEVAGQMARQLADRISAIAERTRTQPPSRRTLRRAKRREKIRRFREGARSILLFPLRTASKIWELWPAFGFAKLRTIDLSNVGLGDNLMLWTGLYTLLENGADLCEKSCKLHVPEGLASLAAHLFAPFGLSVQVGAPREPARPMFTPLGPYKLEDVWRAYIGKDWWMNWVEALDRQKSFPRLGAIDKFKTRMILKLSERILYGRTDWTEAKPEYIGYRVWEPLARRLGVSPLQFMAQLKRSLVTIRMAFAAYVDDLGSSQIMIGAGVFNANKHLAVFPCGKSFQSMTPEICRRIAVTGGDFEPIFFIQSDDPWLSQFQEAGVTPNNLKSIDDLLRVVRSSKLLLTTDSFSSHIAQLLRDDFVLVLTRDLRENIVHPAANPHIVANHPGCAPCNYHARSELGQCLAGFAHCLAFDSPNFVENIVGELSAASVKAKASATPQIEVN